MAALYECLDSGAHIYAVNTLRQKKVRDTLSGVAITVCEALRISLSV